MNKGLTLFETILYISLLSVVIALSMPRIIDLEIWRSLQSEKSTAFSDYVFLEGKIRYLVENAESVLVPRIDEKSEYIRFNFDGENIKVFVEEGEVLVDNGTDIHSLRHKGTGHTELNFSRLDGDINTVQFSAILSGINFGTSTYLFENE